MLSTTGLGDLFQGHLCYGDTLTEKGITIRTLMTRHGLQNSIYVGDTQGDADACQVAGVPFCFAAYGFGQVERYATRIEAFSDLLALPCTNHPDFS
jgi:phosphoglycolate phosphatase